MTLKAIELMGLESGPGVKNEWKLNMDKLNTFIRNVTK